MSGHIGIISAVVGPSVGPAGSIAYDVVLNTPSGVTTLPSVAPSVQRFPDDLDVRAFAVGDPVMFASVKNQYRMMSSEIPDFGDCTLGAADPGQQLLVAVAGMSEGQRAQLRRLLNA